MDIFETDRARIKRRLQAFLPILLLAAVCLIFYLGITGAGRETVTKEQTTLKRALEQGAIHTYALTGNYPQNLEELLTDYKISYDPDKFVVEYVPNSSNLLPSISVLILSQQKGGLS